MKKPFEKKNAHQAGWKTQSSEYLLESPYGNFCVDQVEVHGHAFRYHYVEHPGAVFCMPVTKDFKIGLIRIFRYPCDQWCIEVPSGTAGDKPGKTLLEIAKDEALEEAGAAASDWILLNSLYSANGLTNIKHHYFLGINATYEKASPEIGEMISGVEMIDVQQIPELVSNGKVNDGDSVLALLLTYQYFLNPRLKI